jgi:hypothetical protein
MKLAEFGKLTEAEQAVVDGLGTGHVTVLGDGMLPGPGAGDDRRVGARLIRWLALGAPGDDDVRLHEKGLRIAGALVVSDGQADPLLEKESTPGLDLQGCKLDHDLLLLGCRFQDAPVLRGARVQTLNLQGSALPGLSADRLEAWGGVVLRGVRAEGEVRLLGARIGGDLDCEGGRFENQHDVKKEKTVPGSTGKALNADGARVTGAFFWRQGSHAEGAIDLTAAEIGDICDDPACWPGPGDLLLDRCRYGAFTGQGISASERIRWLGLLDPAQFGKDFWPQPWEHCAQVLREMGHAEDAREVLIAKEQRQRAARRARLRKATEGTWRHARAPLYAVGDALLGLLVAYGHKPLRAVLWLLLLTAIGWAVFEMAWERGGFKPNIAFILRSAEWAQCADGGDRWAGHSSTLDCYLDQPEAAGYPAFNAPLYSLDTLVPVVDLEVQDYWVPDGAVAAWARAYLWAHIAMGWFLALLAVAGFSGLIDTRATKD